MDTFSHGLWAGVIAKGVNNVQSRRRVNVWATMLWGVFPDLFSFSIPFLWLIFGVMFGGLELGEFGKNQPPIAEPLGRNTILIYSLSGTLYNLSHSLVIFSLVFLGVWAYFKQIRVELLGWFIHILMDIPTHTYAFFPTPVFWPIFDWKFSGFQWGQWWFIILNYTTLLFVYLWVRGDLRLTKKLK